MGVTYTNSPSKLPTIGSLIFDISSFPTRLIIRTNDPDWCCIPRSHIPTDNDPTRLLSRVGIWDRALSQSVKSLTKKPFFHGYNEGVVLFGNPTPSDLEGVNAIRLHEIAPYTMSNFAQGVYV